MILLQQIAYEHPNKELFFSDINLSVPQQGKMALIGNNGSGKSTLLKIIAGELLPACGTLKVSGKLWYIPQLLGQFNHLTIAEALGVSEKLHALHQILGGNVSVENMTVLADDWTIDERCKEALRYWQLSDLSLHEKMNNVSGGQKTKAFLAGIAIHQPDTILMDEPGNHLDNQSRELLYQFIQDTNATLLIVSHDRVLLNLLNTTLELNKKGIFLYGGNYDFYASQKQIEVEALYQHLQTREKSLRKAKEKERETIERQQKLDARGKQKQEKAGMARIMMNTLRNKAEKSTAKSKATHTDKLEGIARELQEIRQALPETDKMKFGFDNSLLHKGKVLVSASKINFSYSDVLLWEQNLDLQILSGERLSLGGNNGSGKTTLIKIISGRLKPTIGSLYRSDCSIIYIDQDYSLLNNQLNVYEQTQQFNTTGLEEHEVKIRLHRFLFGKDDWHKPCATLSGGERMRLALCCLTTTYQAPDIMILDEPTNNIDIQNTDILIEAISEYHGTLIVVSHDEYFKEKIGIKKHIELYRNN